jgi:hypothetical protein
LSRNLKFAVSLQKELQILKKVALIVLFLAFSLRPAYYIGQLLYFELNIDYIIETYCVNKDKPQLQCNGKCQLAKQLQLVSAEDNSDANQPTSIVFEAFFPVFILSTSIDTFEIFIENNFRESFFSYQNNYSYLTDFHLDKPPTT